MTKFTLEIVPAIPVDLRHKMVDFLRKEGYNVWSSGQFINGSLCDIGFDSPDESKRETNEET